ncbi:methyltransferase-like protein 22 [Hydra vulgaris]|uniref:Methyltransferase-like protein 22 n=1 Tax=Hydra vulgaris TaxID=6087 RepID=A0ABM4C7P9_HYDVU
MNHDIFVLSEVHLCKTKNKISSEKYITRFCIKCSTHIEPKSIPLTENTIDYDSDGDLNTNRTEFDNNAITLTIIHCNSTHLNNVGKQVWAASLLMADYIIYSDVFKDCYCIELGAGVGICSILASFKASHVFSTDKENDILCLTQENYELNCFMRYYFDAFHKKTDQDLNVSFRKLNWFNVEKQHNEVSLNQFLLDLNLQDSNSEFSWIDKDCLVIEKTNIIIAADCIYDEELTDQLFHVIFTFSQISNFDVIVFFSIEKRLNFSIEELDVSSPSYEHFRNLLHCYSSSNNISITNIPLDFPIFVDYERSSYLELWRIDIFK